MQNILESMMLLCFGFSWPISVVNNYRSRTTRGMSLPFILLIIFGYICGITAKLISHNITYVLAVYIFNLLAVSTNLLVYFTNLGFILGNESFSHNTAGRCHVCDTVDQNQLSKCSVLVKFVYHDLL